MKKTVVYLVVLAVLCVGIVLALTLSGCETGPRRCIDYSYKMSRMPGNDSTARCPYPMKMSIEQSSFLNGTMVHCRCTTEFLP